MAGIRGQSPGAELHGAGAGEVVDAGARAPELRGLAEVELAPTPLEQTVVDRHRVRRLQPAQEGRHVAAALPRRLEREGEDVDLARHGIQGVAGVEERRLAVGVEAHPDVGDPREVVVDQGVLVTERGDGQRADLRR